MLYDTFQNGNSQLYFYILEMNSKKLKFLEYQLNTINKILIIL